MGAALPTAAKERVSVRSLLFRPQRGADEDGLLVSVASPPSSHTAIDHGNSGSSFLFCHLTHCAMKMFVAAHIRTGGSLPTPGWTSAKESRRRRGH